MNEPIYVTKPFLPPLKEYEEKLSELWDSHMLSNMGKFHGELERMLKEYLMVPYVMLFVNGHTSLELLIQSMGLTGEVITTPFTFASTTHAIVRNGLEPVFCDINPSDFTIDADKIESLITERTSAIVAVHVYGYPCEVEKIGRIARKYKLKVIYDAAHAFGVKINGIGIGNFGDSSMYSFHATKVFHSIEGGAAVVKNLEMGYRLHQLKNFGLVGEGLVNCPGINGKMNEFQAAMGLCNLKYIDEEIEKRRIISQRYRENLEGKEGIFIPALKESVAYNYAYFPILFEEETLGYSRDTVSWELNQNQIYPRKYFYPLTSSFSCYSDRVKGETPVAEQIASQVLTLPLYGDLKLEDVDRISQIILKIKR